MDKCSSNKYARAKVTGVKEECGRDAEPAEFFGNQWEGACCICSILVSNNVEIKIRQGPSRVDLRFEMRFT